MRRAGLGRRSVVAGRELNILWNIHENRTGTAVLGDMKGLMYHVGQLLGLFDQPVVLRAGASDADGISFLKGIVADHKGRDLTRQNDDRDRVHQGIRQPGNGVRRTRTGRHQSNADLSGRTRIAFGGMHGTLFVADKDVLNFVLLKDLVIDR